MYLYDDLMFCVHILFLISSKASVDLSVWHDSCMSVWPDSYMSVWPDCVWHVLFKVCVTRLSHSLCDMTLSQSVWWLSHSLYNMTHSQSVWHDSFTICVTRPTSQCACEITHSQSAWHGSFCMTWLTHSLCGTSNVTVCVTQLIHSLYNTTHSQCAWHDPFPVCVARLMSLSV